MKYTTLLLSLTLLLLLGCGGEFTLIEATSQDWMGGAPGSGGGTNYVVKIQKPENMAAQVVSVWLGDRKEGKRFETVTVYAGEERYILKDGKVPAENPTFRVEFTAYNAGRPNNPEAGMPQMESNPKVTEAPADLPEAFTKGALIQFASGKVLFVPEFKEMEQLIHP